MEHVTELLSAYLDNMLSETERRKTDAHLSTCPQCQRELTELKAVSKMVAEIPQKPLPAGFMERLQRRRESEASSSWLPQWMMPEYFRPVALAFSAIAVLVVIFEQTQFRHLSDNFSLKGSSANRSELRLDYKENKPVNAVSNTSAENLRGPISGLGGKAEKDNGALAPAENEGITHRRYAKKSVAMGAMAGQPAAPAAAPSPSMAQSATLQSAAGSAGGVSADTLSLQQMQKDKEFRDQLKSSQIRQAPASEAMVSNSSLAKTTSSGRNFTLNSQQQLINAWSLCQIAEPLPSVDFSNNRVVLVCAQAPGMKVEISDVRFESSRTLVLYQEIAANAATSNATGHSYRIIPIDNTSVVFQTQP